MHLLIWLGKIIKYMDSPEDCCTGGLQDMTQERVSGSEGSLLLFSNERFPSDSTEGARGETMGDLLTLRGAKYAPPSEGLL